MLEAAAVWIFQDSINKNASAALNECLNANGIAKQYSQSASETTCFTTYPRVAIFLLKKYAIDEVIAETAFAITRFSQL